MKLSSMFVGLLAGLSLTSFAKAETSQPIPLPPLAQGDGSSKAADLSIASSGDLSISGDVPIRTWQEALTSAYAFNPDLKLSQAELRITQEGRKQVWGEFAPEISGVLSQDANKEEQRGVNTLNEAKRARVQLTQSLFSSGGTVARLKETSRNVSAADMSLVAAENKLLLEALSAFLQVYSAQKALKFYQDDERRSQQIYDQTKARFEVGEVTYTDVLSQESQVAASNARRVTGEGTLASAQARFESIIGKPAAECLVWPENVPFQIPTKLDQLIARALKENPSVQARCFTEDAARYGVTSQITRGMLPRIEAEAFAAHRDFKRKIDGPNVADPQSSGYVPSRDYNVLVRMVVPIPTGVPQSHVRVKEQNRAQATFNRQKAQLEVRAQVVKAWADLEAAIKNVNQYQVEVKASQQAFDGAQEEFALGLKTVYDVALIQGRLLQSELNLIDANQRVIIAKAQIQSLLGGFLTKNLKLTVHQYNPEATNTWFGIGE